MSAKNGHLPLDPDEVMLSRTALLRAEYGSGTGAAIGNSQAEDLGSQDSYVK